MKYFISLMIIAFLLSCKNDAPQQSTSGTSAEKTKEPTMLKAEKDNGGLFLPDGFGALVVADSVGPTRHITVNANGDIYAKLRIIKGNKGNVALRDTDGDGKANIIKRFGNYPNDGSFATEMRIHNGYLYFSSERVIYRQKLTPPKLIPDSQPEVILVDQQPLRWHNAKTLAFDNRGGMYVTFSAPTNACEDWSTIKGDNYANVKGENPCRQLRIFAGIWVFDEARPNQLQSDGIRYATGLRSIVGMTWNETDNSLYAINHGRDYLHSHAPQHFTTWQDAVLPAEEFMRIKKGDDFGWPYTYYDPFKKKRMLAPEYGGDGKKEATEYANPIMGLPAHWAPNDLLFYKGNQFPERYKNGAFIAFHGSTNRTPYPQAGYLVAFVPFKNGAPIGHWEVFADGFTGLESVKTMDEVKYRPMGLAEGTDGSLYISESRKGKIWRVLYEADPASFKETALVQMEARKQLPHIRIPKEIKGLK